jgi:cellulose biosynthesis protein BcsQ
MSQKSSPVTKGKTATTSAPHPVRVAIVNIKGGAAKTVTTLTLALAITRVNPATKICVLDLDPLTRTSTLCLKRFIRQGEHFFPEAEADLVLLDVGGAGKEAEIPDADYWLIPCATTMDGDIRVSYQTIDAIREKYPKADRHILWLFQKMQGSSGDHKIADSLESTLGKVTVLESRINHRRAYGSMQSKGWVAISKNPAALSEALHLAKEFCKIIALSVK